MVPYLNKSLPLTEKLNGPGLHCTHTYVTIEKYAYKVCIALPQPTSD